MLVLGATFLLIAGSAGITTEPPEAFYFYYAGDGNEETVVIDSSEPVDEKFIKEYISDPENNGYWLFTRANPVTPQILRYNNSESIKRSNFKNDKMTAVLVHGWRGSCNSEINIVITEALLQNEDVNVIVFDWSPLAGKGYVTAKTGVPDVGACLGLFIKWLVTLGPSYEKMHLIGFSLGGHLVGNAARETGGKIERVTALDPAGPLWYTDYDRLNASDAKYVEVIHSSILGYLAPIGHVDFYPNGGAYQPGCGSTTCAHSRAYVLMAASIKFNHFKGYKCKNLVEMEFNKCKGDIELMGNNELAPKVRGVYRLNTEKMYPYEVIPKHYWT